MASLSALPTKYFFYRIFLGNLWCLSSMWNMYVCFPFMLVLRRTESDGFDWASSSMTGTICKWLVLPSTPRKRPSGPVWLKFKERGQLGKGRVWGELQPRCTLPSEHFTPKGASQFPGRLGLRSRGPRADVTEQEPALQSKLQGPGRPAAPPSLWPLGPSAGLVLRSDSVYWTPAPPLRTSPRASPLPELHPFRTGDHRPRPSLHPAEVAASPAWIIPLASWWFPCCPHPSSVYSQLHDHSDLRGCECISPGASLRIQSKPVFRVTTGWFYRGLQSPLPSLLLLSPSASHSFIPHISSECQLCARHCYRHVGHLAGQTYVGERLVVGCELPPPACLRPLHRLFLLSGNPEVYLLSSLSSHFWSNVTFWQSLPWLHYFKLPTVQHLTFNFTHFFNLVHFSMTLNFL